MKALKVIGIVTLGAAAGMVVANYLTDGAVLDAVSDVVDSVKSKFMENGQAVVETVADATEDVADVVGDAADSI